jgi:maltooligosyltrehalose trehalohydrolase
MERDDHGWWHPAAEHRGAYRFVVDGDALADPRSPWQPAGTFGPSHTVDHEAFRWSDAVWHGRPLAASVLYELHVGTFSEAGTFEGAIEHLDHLVELGVNAVELLPVAEFPGRRGWGYDGVLLYAPHHAYGGPDGLKQLVDACHRRGLAVLLDVVYNHLGPSGNHLARFGPYFTDRYRTPWGDAVNLDGDGSDEVRRFLIDNALGWLEHYHVDGLRIDAVHAFADRSAVHVLEELAGAVGGLGARLGRQLWLIAESDLNDPRLVRPPEAGGFGLDASWSDDFHHALHVAFTGEQEGYYQAYRGLGDVAVALERVYVHDGRYDPGRGRRHGRPVGDLSRHRFLGYAQNHDQVGNRATGDRLSQLLEPEALAAVAALVLTAPFVPMLFQGEEWAASTPFQYFTDHSEQDLGAAVREGRRREFAAFGWAPEDVPDPQDPATFERSRLRWDEAATPPHDEMLTWYRQLVRLRVARADLLDGRAGATRVTFDEEQRWLVVERGAATVVAVNLAAQARRVPVPAGARTVLAGFPSGTAVGGVGAVQLPAGGVVVMAAESEGV